MRKSRLNREDLINQIARVLDGIPDVGIAYLFGSFIKGDEFRDIDLALFLKVGTLSPYQEWKLAMRVGRELEKEVTPRYEFDVRVLNNAPLSFKFAVLKEGERVFCRDEESRIAYEAETISAYQDYKDVLEEFNTRLLEVF